MRYLTLGEVVELHRLVLGVTGGAPGIAVVGSLLSPRYDDHLSSSLHGDGVSRQTIIHPISKESRGLTDGRSSHRIVESVRFDPPNDGPRLVLSWMRKNRWANERFDRARIHGYP